MKHISMVPGAVRGGLRRSLWCIASLSLALVNMAPTSATPRPITDAPSYSGSAAGSSSCFFTYQTSGFEPADDGNHPLFVYLEGTLGDYQSPTAQAITSAMAARGYVAISAAYDNSVLGLLGDKTNIANCLFNTRQPNSLLEVACRKSHVSCDLGITVWGHSLGGALTLHARDIEPRVGAAVAMGVGANVLPYALDKDRVRVLNGASEGSNASEAPAVSGASAPADCPYSATQCLRANGSGWVIVPAGNGSVADHCWFRNGGCLTWSEDPAPAFLADDASTPYTITSISEWLQSMTLADLRLKAGQSKP